MRSHGLGRSWSEKVRRVVLLAAGLWCAVGATGCPREAQVPDKGAAPIEMALSDKGEIQALREIADRILVSLATYHYGEMEPWLDKGQVASGAQAAQILLGSRARSAILEGWNAEAIRVEIGPDGQNAATTVDLLYRATPNREARPVEFTFRFRRAQDGGWVLNLSPEP